MKKISILGSTGSVGTQTLDVIRIRKDIRVEAIAARSNIGLLEKQIREFKPRLAAVFDEKKAAELALRVKDTPTRVTGGKQGILDVSAFPKSDLFLSAIVGMAGIEPAVTAIREGKDIALANKETLVCAGHIIMPLAEEYGVRILPVDSEHSAIFQCLKGNRKNRIEKILLTASGGPFLHYTRAKLKTIRPEDALKNPNWKMGKKVTVDSSTMINKGLEVLEAHWLFGTPIDRIEVVIQPQSIIHSMVQFEDGAVMAQLGMPDMKLPIQYALYYPKRKPLPVRRIDFGKLDSIRFEKPDRKKFPGLELASSAGRKGGSMPVVFNAADEEAVSLFLSGKIRYTEITDVISEAMEEHEHNGILKNPSVSEILDIQNATIENIERKRFKT